MFNNYNEIFISWWTFLLNPLWWDGYDYNRWYSVRQPLTTCHPLWQHVTPCDNMSPPVTTCHHLWQHVTPVTTCHPLWQHVTSCDNMSPPVTTCHPVCVCCSESLLDRILKQARHTVVHQWLVFQLVSMTTQSTVHFHVDSPVTICQIIRKLYLRKIWNVSTVTAIMSRICWKITLQSHTSGS